MFGLSNVDAKDKRDEEWDAGRDGVGTRER